jgi:hypothetical protein
VAQTGASAARYQVGGIKTARCRIGSDVWDKFMPGQMICAGDPASLLRVIFGRLIRNSFHRQPDGNSLGFAWLVERICPNGNLRSDS